MKKIAYVIKGQTFFRAVGTLISFSNKAGILPVVFVYKTRNGKSYDNVKDKTLAKCLSYENKEFEVCWISNDKELRHELIKRKIKNIICQDAQHHFSFLLKDFQVFSIAMFFDTLHYAYDRFNKELIPTKAYFPSIDLEKKFNEKTKGLWVTCAIGSPSYDHSLFVKDICDIDVLFLAPPPMSIKPHHSKQINDVVKFCSDNHLNFVLKDRAKAPYDRLNTSVKRYTEESGFPYTSMELLVRSKVHITAYGTSAFESNFLGKPAINLPVINGGGYNYQVARYDLDNIIFNNGLCNQASNDLLSDIKKSLNVRRDKERVLRFDDNYSLDILNDVLISL